MENGNENKNQTFDGKIFLTKKEINNLVMGIDFIIRDKCKLSSDAFYGGDKVEEKLIPYFDLRKKLAIYYEQLNG